MATAQCEVEATTLEVRADGARLVRPGCSSVAIDCTTPSRSDTGSRLAECAAVGDREAAGLDAQDLEIRAFDGDATARISWLNLSRNALEAFTNVTLPSFLVDLDLSENLIERIELVRLPASLRTIDLRGNPLHHVEIRASDVEVFAGLQVSPLIQLRQTQCLDPHAVIQTIRHHSVCVVSDSRFDEKRSGQTAVTSSVSTVSRRLLSASARSSSPSQFAVSMIAGSIALAILIAVACWVWWWRRRRRNQHMRELEGTFRSSITAHSEYADALTPDTNALIAQWSGHRRKSFTDVPLCATSPELYRQLATTSYSDSIEAPPESPVDKSGTFLDSPTFDSFRLDTDEVEEGELLHQGLFTTVFKATRRVDGEVSDATVIIRKLSSQLATQAESIREFMRDIALSSTFQHPNIVALLGFYIWHPAAADEIISSPVAVSEFIPCGDLATLLKRSTSGVDALQWLEPSSIPQSKAGIALDVANALVYLHYQASLLPGQSLKAQKVLLTEDYTAKICSLSVNRGVRCRANYSQTSASVAWLAPEIIRGEAPSALSDVYSFGVLLTELDTCAAPFVDALDCDSPGRSQQDHLAMLLSSGCIRPAPSASCPEPIQQLAMRCLSFDPTDRPLAIGVQHILRKLVDHRNSISSSRLSASMDERPYSLVD